MCQYFVYFVFFLLGITAEMRANNLFPENDECQVRRCRERVSEAQYNSNLALFVSRIAAEMRANNLFPENYGQVREFRERVSEAQYNSDSELFVLRIATEIIENALFPENYGQVREFREMVPEAQDNQIITGILHDELSPSGTENHSALSSAIVGCLKDVCATPEACFADLCSADGHVAWKAALCRAKEVYAVDKDSAFLEKGMKKWDQIRSSTPSLKEKQIRFMKGDVLKFLKNKGRTEKFDITWSGNCIHLLNFTETKEYMNGLYNITKKGGIAWLTARAPWNAELADFLQEQRAEGNPALGYVVLYKESTEDFNETCVDVTDMADNKEYNALCSLHETALHSPDVTVNSAIKHKGKGRFNKGTVNILNIILNVYDPMSLSNLVETHGFKVEDCFYITSKYLKQDTNQFILGSEPATVVVKARKV